MAEDSNRSTPWLAFLVGGLLVAVAIIGYVVYAGGRGVASSVPDAVNVDVELPKAPSLPDAPRLPDAPIPTPK